MPQEAGNLTPWFSRALEGTSGSGQKHLAQAYLKTELWNHQIQRLLFLVHLGMFCA